MYSSFRHSSIFLVLLVSWLAFPSSAWPQASPSNGGDFSQNSEAKKLPTNVILVKGAWASATDNVTPVPESGSIADNLYSNPYFSLAYTLPPGWIQKFAGPPPSDSGYYVLAQFRPAETSKDSPHGSILVAAQDLFFTQIPAKNALELVLYAETNLSPDYTIERTPGEVTIASHTFIRYDYSSPVAELHWHVLTTQIRCHTLQFIFTSRDVKLTDALIAQMNSMKLPAEADPTSGRGGGQAPICIKDYASGENFLESVDPFFTERRFNPVPVRVIVDKEGKVKHIHFLSAFPEQAKAISDALSKWRFKPYLQDGQPVEVETGIMFGHAPRLVAPASNAAVNE
jgi:Gram-negative bacterial TonB protein C-terminal